MMTHGRKNGEKQSYAIPVWNGIFDHYARIGKALWEFIWCVDHVTKERDGMGLVHGGAPVKIERIASDLRGSDRETVRRHLTQLQDAGYIRSRRTPYGQVIQVVNSRKFNIWRKEKPQNAVSLDRETAKCSERNRNLQSEILQNAVSKEDSAVDSAIDAAVPVLTLQTTRQDLTPEPVLLAANPKTKIRRVDTYGVTLAIQGDASE